MKKRLFKNKYCVDSLRLPGWDYSAAGFYFVTICTKHRVDYFGKVNHNNLVLNRLGWIAKKYLREIPQHYPFVKVDSFIIMTNHIHVILNINKNLNNKIKFINVYVCNRNNNIENSSNTVTVEARNCNNNIENSSNTVEARNCAPLHGCVNKFGMVQSKNLSAIIRAYKSTVKKYANKNNVNFEWQERFYDHIINDDIGLNNVRQYIKINPIKMINEKNNKPCL